MENEFHICVRVCGVEGRGKSLPGQFFFVCEKGDRGESSMKSLGGMTRPKDEMGSQIVFSEFDIFPRILVYLSWNNNTEAQARRFPALTAPEPEFPVIFGSKWDPLTSAWRQGGASPERLAELPTGHLQETKSHKTFSWNKGKSILFYTIWPSHYIWLSLFFKSCSSYLELSSSTYSYVHILYLL